MRIANLQDRAVLIVDGDGTPDSPGRAVDVERASDGRFGPRLESVLEGWEDFREWAAGADLTSGESTVGQPYDPAALGAPVPRPRQVFGIGLNYRDHAQEAGLDIPSELLVFTKFASCLTGPVSRVSLPSDRVDWEVELVVVIGSGGLDIPPEEAWDRVAGLTIGQDLSERRVQFAVKPPQFSLGKSYPGFGPIGPAIVTTDELGDRDALAIGCDLDGEPMQAGTTSDFIFPVAQLVSRLSQVVRLLPGDLIFTGTPAGVGSVRTPRRYLAPGETLVSRIEGLGELTTHLV